jgi:hypothetical protein
MPCLLWQPLNEIYVQHWTAPERSYTLTGTRPSMLPADGRFPNPDCESGGELAVAGSHGLLRQI